VSEKTSPVIPPSKALLAAWLIMAALLLVFARDVSRQADSTESPLLRPSTTTGAGLLLGVAQSLGVVKARESMQSAVHFVYDNPLMLAGRAYQVNTQHETITAQANDPVASTEATAAPVINEPNSKSKPSSILVIGDSSIQGSLGLHIERKLEEYEDVVVHRFGQHSTGIARPDYFDWWDKIEELKAEYEPDLILAHWGDNDCQGLSSTEGEFLYHFNTDEWDAEYGRRIEDITRLMREGGCDAVLIGAPIMRSKSFSKKIERLNTVVEAAVTKAGGLYISTWDLTSDDAGDYMVSVEFEGKKRVIRAADGIHLSVHGAAYVADGICSFLEDHFTMVPLESAE